MSAATFYHCVTAWPGACVGGRCASVELVSRSGSGLCPARVLLVTPPARRFGTFTPARGQLRPHRWAPPPHIATPRALSPVRGAPSFGTPNSAYLMFRDHTGRRSPTSASEKRAAEDCQVCSRRNQDRSVAELVVDTQIDHLDVAIVAGEFDRPQAGRRIQAPEQ